jgi:hypothetical protein
MLGKPELQPLSKHKALSSSFSPLAQAALVPAEGIKALLLEAFLVPLEGSYPEALEEVFRNPAVEASAVEKAAEVDTVAVEVVAMAEVEVPLVAVA